MSEGERSISIARSTAAIPWRTVGACREGEVLPLGEGERGERRRAPGIDGQRGNGRDSYFPGFLEPRRIAKKALTAVIQEAYVQGI